MSDPEVVMEDDDNVDRDMSEPEGVGTVAEETIRPEDETTGLEDIEPTIPERVTFLDYLRSPIVSLVLGPDSSTSLFAHQGLLVQSPFFNDTCAQFSADATVRRIQLPNDDIDATASVLEFLYRGDYFPTLSGSQALEYDPTIPQPDNDGIALLRHARVYTLAQKWGLPALTALAHKKIHLTQSTARGEIAYARFVYAETSPEDESIRRPVAAFWAQRSYVLRHEAEQEFKRMCLEYPQFGFDVLSLVLDMQEKRSQRAEAASSQGGTGRKRVRVSAVVT